MAEEKDTKKDVQAVAKQCTSNNSTTSSIPQNTENTQPQTPQKKSRKSQKKPLSINSRVYSIAIKCYEEQLVYGLEETYRRIRAFDKSRMHILAMLHNRDLVTDGIWVTPFEKGHLHIIGHCSSREKREYVSKVLNDLGIYFRPGVDDNLWQSGGVETVGDFTEYAMYCLHATEKAILDGKEPYDITEFVSNLSQDEIKQVLDGYTRIVDPQKRLTTGELEALDKSAYELGYNLGNFNQWYGSQPFLVRSNSKMRTIRESYNRGVDDRIEEGVEMCRVCIFIHGKGNTGKTYASKKALAGKRILDVGGGGTGKFDKLRPDTDAIVVDDDVIPNLLNMADNYICRAYRRSKDNPAWAGQYLIVTSNLTFDEWVTKCGITAKTQYGRETANYTAVKTRFCIGRILRDTTGKNQLFIEHMSSRGSGSVLAERKELVKDFLQKFNQTIAQYDPQKAKIDYSDVVTDLSMFTPIT